jgi:hypothetical protein
VLIGRAQFEDSMITKIFLFQFVNSYASFFYLAFIAESMGDCHGAACMSGLTINLATIFGTRLLVGNIMELLIPYLSYLYKYREETKRARGHMSQPENEFLLDKVMSYTTRCCTAHLLCWSDSCARSLRCCAVRPNVVEPGGLRGGGDRVRVHGAVRVRPARGGRAGLRVQRRGDPRGRLAAAEPAPTALPEGLRGHRELVRGLAVIVRLIVGVFV